MPAKNLLRVDTEGIYCHVYNKGIENRIIFNDLDDYKVFLNYLEEYLSSPKDPKNIKQKFKVKGKTFQGVPHQPKNYFNKVELIAYSLMPNHFHLLLRQTEKGSVEKLIRSLGTRYSIYFNKKYKRSGTLFVGPYKSAQIEKEVHLPYLTRHLHKDSEYSSFPEYIGSRKTSWVKPEAVLSSFANLDEYKTFVDGNEIDPNITITNILLEEENDHLERRDSTSGNNTQLEQVIRHRSRMPEFLTIFSALFLLLSTLGIVNVNKNLANNNHLTISSVLGKTDKAPSPTAQNERVNTQEIIKVTPTPKELLKTVTVKIEGSQETTLVNIRQEAASTSARIGRAKNGDTFEFISKENDWYQVKISSNSAGFISGQYIMEGY